MLTSNQVCVVGQGAKSMSQNGKNITQAEFDLKNIHQIGLGSVLLMILAILPGQTQFGFNCNSNFYKINVINLSNFFVF